MSKSKWMLYAGDAPGPHMCRWDTRRASPGPHTLRLLITGRDGVKLGNEVLVTAGGVKVLVPYPFCDALL